MTIELVPFLSEDFQRLIQWVPTADFMMLWSGPYFTFPLTEEQLSRYLQSAQGLPPPRRIYKAVESENGQVVGHIELNNIDWKNLAGTVSKVLIGAESLRGQGIGARMMEQLAKIAFDDYGLHRLSLFVFDFNSQAVACYQKVGFKIEGHLKDYRKYGDGYLSSYLMALLESDWRKTNA